MTDLGFNSGLKVLVSVINQRGSKTFESVFGQNTGDLTRRGQGIPHLVVFLPSFVPPKPNRTGSEAPWISRKHVPFKTSGSEYPFFHILVMTLVSSVWSLSLGERDHKEQIFSANTEDGPWVVKIASLLLRFSKSRSANRFKASIWLQHYAAQRTVRVRDFAAFHQNSWSERRGLINAASFKSCWNKNLTWLLPTTLNLFCYFTSDKWVPLIDYDKLDHGIHQLLFPHVTDKLPPETLRQHSFTIDCKQIYSLYSATITNQVIVHEFFRNHTWVSSIDPNPVLR
jgi:hypothetical protein